MSDEEKVMSIRLNQEQADLLEAASRVQGVPVAQAVRDAIAARIEELRHDEEFQTRLRESIERDREILERLAPHDGPVVVRRGEER